MTQIRDLYVDRLLTLNMTVDQQDQILNRLHFSNISVLSEPASFIQDVLLQWVSPANVVQVTNGISAPGT